MVYHVRMFKEDATQKVTRNPLAPCQASFYLKIWAKRDNVDSRLLYAVAS